MTERRWGRTYSLLPVTFLTTSHIFLTTSQIFLTTSHIFVTTSHIFLTTSQIFLPGVDPPDASYSGGCAGGSAVKRPPPHRGDQVRNI